MEKWYSLGGGLNPGARPTPVGIGGDGGLVCPNHTPLGGGKGYARWVVLPQEQVVMPGSPGKEEVPTTYLGDRRTHLHTLPSGCLPALLFILT